jgi:hypothetical protein
MRTTVNDGKLCVDLLATKKEAHQVVGLAFAAGLTNVHVANHGDGSGVRILVGPEEGGWGFPAFAAMALLCAELDGKSPADLIEQFRSEVKYDDAKALLGL